jgi:hypothetical protein
MSEKMLEEVRGLSVALERIEGNEWEVAITLYPYDNPVRTYTYAFENNSTRQPNPKDWLRTIAKIVGETGAFDPDRLSATVHCRRTI